VSPTVEGVLAGSPECGWHAGVGAPRRQQYRRECFASHRTISDRKTLKYQGEQRIWRTSKSPSLPPWLRRESGWARWWPFPRRWTGPTARTGGTGTTRGKTAFPLACRRIHPMDALPATARISTAQFASVSTIPTGGVRASRWIGPSRHERSPSWSQR